jgi:hypothetical protein
VGTTSLRDAFDNPASYRICVQGQLGDEWSERLSGLRMTVLVPAGELPVTVLTGKLRDQAALAGVLSTLYDLHLPVISVERLSAGSSGEEAH